VGPSEWEADIYIRLALRISFASSRQWRTCANGPESVSKAQSLRILVFTTIWGICSSLDSQSGRGYIAYCGRYEVDEEKLTVAHIPSVTLRPSLIGGRHIRSVALCGNNLTLCTRGALAENEPAVISRLAWRKVARTPLIAPRILWRSRYPRRVDRSNHGGKD